MLHNSAGQSPYLYHLATREKYKDENRSPIEMAIPPHAKVGDDPKSSKLGNAGCENGPQKTDMQKANRSEKRGWQKSNDPKESASEEKPNESIFNKEAFQKPPMNGQKPGDLREGSQRSYSTVKKGVKNKLTRHALEDIRPSKQISNEVSQLLKERVFDLGGYKEAYKCLFRYQIAHVPPSPRTFST